jgi:hypothetical protein
MIDSGVKCKVLLYDVFRSTTTTLLSVIISHHHHVSLLYCRLQYQVVLSFCLSSSLNKTEEEGREKKQRREKEKKRETDLKNTGSCFSRCPHFSFSVYLLLAVSSINHNIIIFYDRVVYIALIHNFLPIHMNI